MTGAEEVVIPAQAGMTKWGYFSKHSCHSWGFPLLYALTQACAMEVQ